MTKKRFKLKAVLLRAVCIVCVVTSTMNVTAQDKPTTVKQIAAKQVAFDVMSNDELKSSAAEYNPNTHLVGTGIVKSARYAALLYERGAAADVVRANEVLSAVLGFQVTDEAAVYYGQFPFFAGGNVNDHNVALFLAPTFLRDLPKVQDRMPPALGAKFREAADRILLAANRRWDEEVFSIERDYKGYTNIFVMYTRALLLGAQNRNDARMLRKAEAQWQRWFNQVSYYGIDEFASPSYSEIVYDALVDIYDAAPNGRMQTQVAGVLDYLSAVEYGAFHPLLKMSIVGSSRNYRVFQKQGASEQNIIAKASSSLYRQPQNVTEELANRKFPFAAHGRAGLTPFLFETYQTEHGGMGTMTGGHYLWQQINLMVAVGDSERERAVAFIPGSFTPINGFVAQRENTALCLFARVPNTFFRTQELLSDADIAKAFGGFGIGVTQNWKVAGEDARHLVLSAYDHDVHIYPFTITAGKIAPVQLVYRKRTKTSEKQRYHYRDADFGEYVFPDDAVWFGCWITYTKHGGEVSAPLVTYREANNSITLSSADDLMINLYRQPTGEIVQTYSQDWRTMPLIQSLNVSLAPGELSRRTSNQPSNAVTLK